MARRAHRRRTVPILFGILALSVLATSARVARAQAGPSWCDPSTTTSDRWDPCLSFAPGPAGYAVLGPYRVALPDPEHPRGRVASEAIARTTWLGDVGRRSIFSDGEGRHWSSVGFVGRLEPFPISDVDRIVRRVRIDDDRSLFLSAGGYVVDATGAGVRILVLPRPAFDLVNWGGGSVEVSLAPGMRVEVDLATGRLRMLARLADVNVRAPELRSIEEREAAIVYEAWPSPAPNVREFGERGPVRPVRFASVDPPFDPDRAVFAFVLAEHLHLVDPGVERPSVDRAASLTDRLSNALLGTRRVVFADDGVLVQTHESIVLFDRLGRPTDRFALRATKLVVGSSSRSFVAFGAGCDATQAADGCASVDGVARPFAYPPAIERRRPERLLPIGLIDDEVVVFDPGLEERCARSRVHFVDLASGTFVSTDGLRTCIARDRIERSSDGEAESPFLVRGIRDGLPVSLAIGADRSVREVPEVPAVAGAFHRFPFEARAMPRFDALPQVLDGAEGSIAPRGCVTFVDGSRAVDLCARGDAIWGMPVSIRIVDVDGGETIGEGSADGRETTRGLPIWFSLGVDAAEFSTPRVSLEAGVRPDPIVVGSVVDWPTHRLRATTPYPFADRHGPPRRSIWNPRRVHGDGVVHAATRGDVPGAATVRGGVIDFYGDDGSYLHVDDVSRLRPDCSMRGASSLRILVQRFDEDDPFVRGAEPAAPRARLEKRTYAIDGDRICLESIDSAGLGYGVHLDAWDRFARPIVRLRSGSHRIVRTYDTSTIDPNTRPALPLHRGDGISRVRPDPLTRPIGMHAGWERERGPGQLDRNPEAPGALHAFLRREGAGDAAVDRIVVVDSLDRPSLEFEVPGLALPGEVHVAGTSARGLIAYVEWPLSIVVRTVIDGVVGAESISNASFCIPDIRHVSASPAVVTVLRCGLDGYRRYAEVLGLEGGSLRGWTSPFALGEGDFPRFVTTEDAVHACFGGPGAWSRRVVVRRDELVESDPAMCEALF